MAEWVSALSAHANPVIMTGHQAEFWHPGILAKYQAAAEVASQVAARGRQARVVWLVVDQDSNEPWKIPYPAFADGKLTRAVWTLPFRGGLHAATAFAPDAPTCALPPIEPPVGHDAIHAAVQALRPALPHVAQGLESIAEALHAHQDAPNAARQVTAALCDLLSPGMRPDSIRFATDLATTPEFAEIVEKIRADPVGCTSSYNAAAMAVPHAHVRPLILAPGRTELPLWRMPSAMGQPRRPVFAEDMASIPIAQLAPRALLMTALVRRSFCNLFIHGTGGGVYDQVTQRWLAAWMPESSQSLAPTAVVTATRYLDFPGPAPASPGEIERARWTAHHARHNPSVVGDDAAQQRKEELLTRLRTARARGESPADAFRALHHFLEKERAAHGPALATLDAAAASAQNDAARAAVVYDRTWSFPLYGPIGG